MTRLFCSLRLRIWAPVLVLGLFLPALAEDADVALRTYDFSHEALNPTSESMDAWVLALLGSLLLLALLNFRRGRDDRLFLPVTLGRDPAYLRRIGRHHAWVLTESRPERGAEVVVRMPKVRPLPVRVRSSREVGEGWFLVKLRIERGRDEQSLDEFVGGAPPEPA